MPDGGTTFIDFSRSVAAAYADATIAGGDHAVCPERDRRTTQPGDCAGVSPITPRSETLAGDVGDCATGHVLDSSGGMPGVVRSFHDDGITQ